MPFTILVVTWNSAAELPALVESFERHLGSCAELVIVDNASEDGSAAVARELAPSARVIELDENVGFGPANNVGVREAATDVVVLINPDTVLVDDSLATLAALARGHDVLVGPRLLNPDGSPQISAFPPFAGWELALIAMVPGAAMPRALRARCEPWRSERRIEAGWLSGACLAGRRTLLAQFGPFDERLPLYGEDSDLCMRARARGVPIVFAPDAARVIHIGNASGVQAFSDGGAARKIEARRWIVRHHLGRFRAVYDSFMQLVLFATRWALKLALRRDREVESVWIRGLLADLRRRGSEQPASLTAGRRASDRVGPDRSRRRQGGIQGP